MREFKLSLGLRATKEQVACLNYILLRTAGITMQEFVDASKDLEGLSSTFAGKFEMENNQMSVGFRSYEGLDAEGARQQILRIVCLNLGLAEVSIGEFQSAVTKAYHKDKK